MYGPGIYFTSDFAKASRFSHFSGTRTVLISEVALGTVLTLSTANPTLRSVGWATGLLGLLGEVRGCGGARGVLGAEMVMEGVRGVPTTNGYAVTQR